MELVLEKTNTKELEPLVEGNKKISETAIEKSLNYDNLTDEEKAAIEKFNSEIDVFDQTQILQFGAAAQDKVSKFSDSVLTNVRTKDTGEVGALLGNLVAEIKSFDSALNDHANTSFIEKIFSSAKKEFDKLIAKYNKIEKNITSIEDGLEKDKLKMLKDINIFDTMYDKNVE